MMLMSPKNPCLVLMVLTVLLAMSAASGGAQSAQRRSTTGCLGVACKFDAYDPRYFLDVMEITRQGERHPIHLAVHARSLTESPEAAVNGKSSRRSLSHEVSFDGSIALRFDRDYLRSLLGGDGFATTMSMRGEYIRGGKVEKLEIPGYSEVGQEARQSRITAIALLPMRLTRAVREFADLRSRVESQIGLEVSRIPAGADSISAAALTKDLQSRVDELIRQSNAESALLQQFEVKMRDSVPPSTATTDSSGAPMVDSAALLKRRLADARAARARAEVAVRAARLKFEDLVEQQERVRYDFERAKTTGAVYLAARDQLLALTDRLSGGNDTLAQNFSALLVGREPMSMVAQGRRIQEAMAALQVAHESSTGLTGGNGAQRSAFTRRLDDLSNTIRDLLESFARLDPPLLPDGQLSSAVSDLLLREFADPTIALMATPVEPGDEVRIVVVSTPKDQGAVRQYSVRIKVVDFGFNERKREISSLVRRDGVSARDNERRVEAFLTAKKRGELFVNDAVAFQPAVGAVFEWQWVPRRSDRARSFVRWIAPSVGVHVSTPQFGARILRFDEDSGTVKIEERRNVTDVGIGLSFGLWDDKVLVTRGWAITAIERRAYLSVGLSLISLADGALSLAKSTR
jgi:hypothetical protein